jgi:hypothetical protein
MLPTAGDMMLLAGGGATLTRSDVKSLMNADAADKAAAKGLLLLLLFCFGQTAGAATLSYWLMLKRSPAGPSSVLRHKKTAVSAISAPNPRAA